MKSVVSEGSVRNTSTWNQTWPLHVDSKSNLLIKCVFETPLVIMQAELISQNVCAEQLLIWQVYLLFNTCV